MKYKRTMIISCAGIILIILANLIGCNGMMKKHFYMHHSHQEMTDFMVNKFSKELKLNESQKEMLKDFVKEMKEKRNEYSGEREDFFNTLITEIESEKLDEKILNQMFEYRMQRMNDMKPIVIAKLVEFHNTLSSEQKEILVKKITEIHDKNTKQN